MSMSTHVVGFIPADDEWNKMLKVWNACDEAGIDSPNHVYEFFDGVDPNGQPGETVELEEHVSVSEHHTDSEAGYQIEISKLPPNVKFIRVYNSY